ncbi:MAG TPA: aminopeptidase [Candidatus Ozemobacteraceae bacterium]|nr:aminopeptidase [Candidatus Ozemobacteraceae bacterium]HQG29234.1 aminopeptidase [Candidatus Ozemobacteraceae bacterium]
METARKTAGKAPAAAAAAANPNIRKYQQANGWDVLEPSSEKVLAARAKRYLEFLSLCKTERETLAYIEKAARSDGFKPLAAEDKKSLKPGDRVFCISKNRAMALAVIGKRPAVEGFRIVAAHHDVPHLDLKSLPLYEKYGTALFKTHYYGGIKKFQWAAIPLSLHVFAVTKAGKTLRFAIGEKPGEPVFTITDIAPHLAAKIQNDRKANETLRGEELNILVGHRPLPKKDKNAPASKGEERVKGAVLEHLFTKYGLEEEDLAWAEIEATPAFEAREVGFDASMIGGFGHDDRACVMAAYEAIREIKIPEYTSIALLFDKEEIGSAGASGAQSMMISDIMNILLHATSKSADYSDLRRAISNTYVLSGDTSVPIDPTFDGAFDPTNSGYLGNGVWICRFTGAGGKSGSSEADIEFIARIRALLGAEKIPYQFGEMGKVDEGGGGTVAKFMAQMNMHVLDLCLPVLSLHSPFEILSKADYHHTIDAYRVFLSKKF